MPIFTSIEEETVGPVALKTSSLVITSFTGLPLFKDKARAIGSIKIVVFPPKPPPISEGVTLNCEDSIPIMSAHRALTL